MAAETKEKKPIEGAGAGKGKRKDKDLTAKQKGFKFDSTFKKRLKKLKPRWPGFRKLFGPFLIFCIVSLFISYAFLVRAVQADEPGRRILLSQVYELAKEGRIVKAVLLRRDAVLAMEVEEELKPAKTKKPAAGAKPAPRPKKPAEPKTFLAWSPVDETGSLTFDIKDVLIKQGVDFDLEIQRRKVILTYLVQFLWPLLILATVFGYIFLVITGQGGGAADFLGFSKFAARVQRRKGKKGGTTFKDVAAIDEGIAELQEVVDYLMNPVQFAEVGARAPKGVLLVGPPGTGKTLLARAVAGEAGVPFIQLSGSEFVESLVGVGAARVRSLFQQARALAPCIVFIDELDAAGRQRGAGVGGGNDEREQTLNQLLVEMDGFATALGVAILGATNRPDILDPALLRPGRFDRQVVIDVPDVRGRVEILKVHSRDRPMGPDCELESIAKQTPGFTGAELANIINEAALLAVRRKRTEIHQDDLEEAVDRVLAGPERKSHILTDEEKLMIAYHEAGHAVVARGAGQETGVLKLSIVARGLQLGHASTFSSADRLIMIRSELEGQLTTLLGGMAAEKLVFGEVTSGNTGDLEKATNRARKMVATLGMTDAVGPVQIVHEGQIFMGRDFAAMQNTSNEILSVVDREIRRILDEAERRALDICKTNRAILDEVVALLLERETMMGPELEPILAKVKRLELPQALLRLADRAGNGAPRRRKHQVKRPVDLAAPEPEGAP